MGNSSTLEHGLKTTSFFNEDQISGAKLSEKFTFLVILKFGFMLLIRQIDRGRKEGQMQRHLASMSEIKVS